MKSFFSLILNAVVALMLGWFLYNNYNELRAYPLKLDYGLLVASVIVVALSYIVQIKIWLLLTTRMGLVAPLWQGVYAWVKGQLGKYVPGKVTILFLRLEVYRGYSRKTVVVATMIEMIMALIASVLVILFCIMMSPSIFPVYVWQSAIVMFFLLAIALWPPVLFGIINYLLLMFNREKIERYPGYATLWVYVAGYVLVSMLHGAAFYLVLSAVEIVDMKYIFIIIGLNELAGLIGVLALFAPGGLGVKEGALFITLPLLVSTTAAVVSVVVFRVLTVLVEIGMTMAAGSMKARTVSSK